MKIILICPIGYHTYEVELKDSPSIEELDIVKCLKHSGDEFEKVIS